MTPSGKAVEAVGTAGAVAVVHRIVGTAGVWSIRVRCPFCARLHSHSGGRTATPPTLGERVSHCHQGSYSLAWPDEGDHRHETHRNPKETHE